jgi:hypothetical protein
MFLATMRLEGRSEKTLFLYRFNIEKMLEKSDKDGCGLFLLLKINAEICKNDNFVVDLS